MKRIIGVLNFLFLFSNTFSQGVASQYIIKKNINNEIYNVIPFGTDGMVIFCDRSKCLGEKNLTISHYNTDFDTLNISIHKLKPGYQYQSVYVSDSVLDFFYYHTKHGRWELVSYQMKNHEISVSSGILQPHLYSFNFVVEAKKIFLAATYRFKNATLPYMAIINLQTEALKEIDIEFQFEIADIEVLREVKEIHFELAPRYSGLGDFKILRMGFDGNQLGKPLLLKENPKYRILASTSHLMEKGNYLFAGTYSKNRLGEPDGIFVAFFDGKRIFNSYYFDFDDFNFSAPVSLSKNLDEFGTVGIYDIFINDVFEQNGNIFLILENYREPLSQEITDRGTFVSDIDGNMFLNTIVICLNEKGLRQWGDIFDFEIDYYLRFGHVLSADQVNDEIRLTYTNPYESFLYTVKNDSLSNASYKRIRIVSQGDVATATYMKNEHWYDNVYLCWGCFDVTTFNIQSVFFVKRVQID